jgi:hypothetical protein
MRGSSGRTPSRQTHVARTSSHQLAQDDRTAMNMIEDGRCCVGVTAHALFFRRLAAAYHVSRNKEQGTVEARRRMSTRTGGVIQSQQQLQCCFFSPSKVQAQEDILLRPQGVLKVQPCLVSYTQDKFVIM